MSLPPLWIDKIFLKLTLIYGRDFIGRWEGLEIGDVKADWGHELAGFDKWPEAIAHALANCPPGKPPTVLEFRELARKAKRAEVPLLPSPAADLGRVAAELAKLAPIVKAAKSPTIDHKAWAKRLMARHDAGEKLSLIQLRFAREALGIAKKAVAA